MRNILIAATVIALTGCAAKATRQAPQVDYMTTPYQHDCFFVHDNTKRNTCFARTSKNIQWCNSIKDAAGVEFCRATVQQSNQKP